MASAKNPSVDCNRCVFSEVCSSMACLTLSVEHTNRSVKMSQKDLRSHIILHMFFTASEIYKSVFEPTKTYP